MVSNSISELVLCLTYPETGSIQKSLYHTIASLPVVQFFFELKMKNSTLYIKMSSFSIICLSFVLKEGCKTSFIFFNQKLLVTNISNSNSEKGIQMLVFYITNTTSLIKDFHNLRIRVLL